MDDSLWTAISSIVAIIALFLSQMPPIKTWFKIKAPLITTSPSLSISHYFGSPDIQLYINLENESSRPIKIKKMELSIKKLGYKVITIEAFTVFEKLDSPIQKAFSPFTIKSESEWSHNVKFFNPFKNSDEKKFKKLFYDIRDHFNKKQQITQNENTENIINQTQPTEIPDNLSRELDEFYKSNVFWEEGDYEFTLNIITGDNSISTSTSFSILLLERDINELNDVFSRYKYGYTIFYPENNAYIFPIIRKTQ
ncbi:hypothetical protein ABRP72_13235 [Pectobacterium carotovorum]|uniref:hypothetical protein n=1 Tax=Pectobacterium carotovorum TaxID=554 RepID=UPI0032EE033D